MQRAEDVIRCIRDVMLYERVKCVLQAVVFAKERRVNRECGARHLVIHANTARRHKSRLTRHLNALG